MVKHPVAMQETRGRSLGWEDPLEKEMATTPVLLPGNPMDRGAWQATVHGVAKGQARLTTSLSFFNPQSISLSQYYVYYSDFTDEKTEALGG